MYIPSLRSGTCPSPFPWWWDEEYPPRNQHSSWKWMVGRLFPFLGNPIFRGYVSFREGIYIYITLIRTIPPIIHGHNENWCLADLQRTPPATPAISKEITRMTWSLAESCAGVEFWRVVLATKVDDRNGKHQEPRPTKPRASPLETKVRFR